MNDVASTEVTLRPIHVAFRRFSGQWWAAILAEGTPIVEMPLSDKGEDLTMKRKDEVSKAFIAFIKVCWKDDLADGGVIIGESTPGSSLTPGPA